jgi:hypothetical protein
MAVESPLVIILEMIAIIITGTINTFGAVGAKLGELFASLEFISGFGALGLFLAIVIMGLVTFFMIKFFAKSGWMLIPFFIIGVILLWVLFLAAF